MFKTSYTGHGNVLIISYVGDVVVNNLEKAKEQFNICMEKNPGMIAFNCSDIYNMDSSGLGMFISFSKTAANRDIRLVLIDVPANISRFFDMPSLEQFFELMSRDQFNKKYL